MNQTRLRLGASSAAVLLALPLAACSDDSSGEDGKDRERTLTVFAAASLTKTFEELERQFEDAHPDVDVKLSFGGSSDLAAQIAEGAEADVFASADTATMDTLVAAQLTVGEPAEFATNTLMIAVPPGNPAGIEQLADLTKKAVRLVLCQPEVPCGRAALQVADVAALELTPVSEEESVSGVLTKVENGEADAGLVYVTDVAAAGDDLEGVDFPEAADVVNHYPIVAVQDAEHAELARQWIDLVLGKGQQVLRKAGFGAPTS
ncbi:molybdate ABC transporter substrate-binding protein [Nocardioides daeguensis]|uniref:Molybdate ABC transporter substrate-binding protein n=1 Tax=Nocardioides daeguensis TaxID=908359 RepID=A0ABP6W330_9ACTN|nr:molybdate ABC transporter substrate-binding protein [Nocardioides daeguensis]MBV6727616.1 molybdate ABC transporter substrate-binding protein [Nocardioides daeguensis]MCR1775088.1 molybdate ABC transporter substrate-binding protein [Nocardioides daeguensis]